MLQKGKEDDDDDIDSRKTYLLILKEAKPGGGGTSLWGKTRNVRQLWVVFGLKIAVIWVYFHVEFSGIGVYCYTQKFGNRGCMKVQLDNSSSNTWSVSGEQTYVFFVFSDVLR